MFFEFLTDKGISIPLGELMLFVLVTAFCLLYQKYRLGLVATLCFVIYWGFVNNFHYFATMLGETTYGMPLYVMSGIALIVLVIIGLYQEVSE